MIYLVYLLLTVHACGRMFSLINFDKQHASNGPTPLATDRGNVSDNGSSLCHQAQNQPTQRFNQISFAWIN